MQKQLKFTAIFMVSSVVYAQARFSGNAYIPDENTAIRIAEKKLSIIYGEQQINSEHPFHAHLKNGIWTVSGSLPANMLGGVATIRLDKQTGKVISYIHGQ
jgi:hypothetical protein